uniref:Uncharacterized protein n=2 Tax=Palpitomonas bilix TaxID=652834 RepID=A0A7S3LWM8_9EUKA|mmetsp:Transcript_5838/g.13826  ORF Transcript_5838/g.13826 Transcript_5838/m.13826 type:complete len:189 (+) Transcript_5838:224-790(+)
MVLNYDINTFNETAVIEALAAAADVPSNRFKIISITYSSVTIIFEIINPTNSTTVISNEAVKTAVLTAVQEEAVPLLKGVVLELAEYDDSGNVVPVPVAPATIASYWYVFLIGGVVVAAVIAVGVAVGLLRSRRAKAVRRREGYVTQGRTKSIRLAGQPSGKAGRKKMRQTLEFDNEGAEGERDQFAV